jgi:hypothetical protein
MGNPRFGPVSSPQSSKSSNDDGATDESSDSTSDSLAVLAFMSQEIMRRMGKDFLEKIPLDVTEQFCLSTVEKNDPTAELLYQLVTNFMKAYAKENTNEEALKAFDYLDYLVTKDS